MVVRHDDERAFSRSGPCVGKPKHSRVGKKSDLPHNFPWPDKWRELFFKKNLFVASEM